MSGDLVRETAARSVCLVRDEELPVPLAIATACAETGCTDHEAVIKALLTRVEAQRELDRRLNNFGV